MSRRTVFTTLTPLPSGIGRDVVMETLRSHTEMIDLNPLVIERHPIKPPPNATPEEYHCDWYSLTDRVQYLPGGLASGQVTYTCCFHDLKDGLQTHCYAPMGLDIKGKWTLGGSLPGEPIAPVELGLGAPLQGLWLREDVDMRCNIMMGGFVKKTLKKAHSSLVGRLLVKSQIQEEAAKTGALKEHTLSDSYTDSHASTEYTSSDNGSQSMAGGWKPQDNALSGSQKSPIFPLQSISSYRPDQSGSRTSYESKLHPTALNIRKSGSSGASQKSSYSGPEVASQQPGNRGSEQILSSSQSPRTETVEAAYLPSSTSRQSQSQRHTELLTQHAQDERQISPMYGQGQGQGQGWNQAQKSPHGLAELE
ncbi:hypothetical protein ONS95_000910 [Cadophora gregata]|uniref:uncharacterized protein n=1 Tax=Cadophora gregata TaxID=51156 RepID=UPI0026DC1263|nr:uncharacterized protein ONS95_000910 [Cadophora gregata]KAK0102895.1 hypothetical protein ONS96_005523 [Cadophora gregata f. sp. sojae]KAK0128967.1 hypothetical protein ONS95_000910 [Cadophora gregata]